MSGKHFHQSSRRAPTWLLNSAGLLTQTDRIAVIYCRYGFVENRGLHKATSVESDSALVLVQCLLQLNARERRQRAELAVENLSDPVARNTCGQ